MITEVSGDILLTHARAIAHGLAPDDHFEHGLALQLRERWPSLARDFRHWHHQAHPKAGEVWTWTAPDGTRVFNLLTQDEATHAKRDGVRPRLEHVNHAFRALRREIEKEQPTSVAIPRIATGVGGLTWEEVRPLIQRHLGDLSIPIYVYAHYKPAQRADEGVARAT